MTTPINQDLITSLDQIKDSQELLRTLFQQFGSRAAIGTSGQLTGSVMIDLACKAGVKPRVFTIDTLRLFPETYQLFDQVEEHYRIKVERVQPDPTKLDKMIAENGEFLFFDSKEKQEFCCHLRKVEPNNRVLDTLDVWFTGLRADQSKARSSTARFQIIEHGASKRPILKVAPLVDWKEPQLRKYIQDNKVPTHKLLDWNNNGWYYESLGCEICTTPVGPTEARRAGRWRWFNALDPNANKECGLHAEKKDEI
jgi:phosphoadenosine phosphosulfate reductase